MGSGKTRGLFFENQALQYLKNRGLRLIDQNFHCRFGEIDLIMLHHTTLCFIEVKYRKNNAFGGTAYSIPLSKQKKITHSALSFISLNKRYAHHALRFDALFIQPDSSGVDAFEWIQNAFCVE